MFKQRYRKYVGLIFGNTKEGYLRLIKDHKTLLRLICGNSCLALYKYHTPETKLCRLCFSNEQESLYHFLMDCENFEIDRMSMLHDIEQSVTEITKNVLFNLQDNVLFNIFLGMDYINEIDDEDLYILRKVSVKC